MKTITQLPAAIQHLLTTTADELAKKTGFIQRQRKLTGAQFAQATVFGWLQHPAATRQQLHQSLLTHRTDADRPGFRIPLLTPSCELPARTGQGGHPAGLLRRDAGSPAEPLSRSLPDRLHAHRSDDAPAEGGGTPWELQGGSLQLSLEDLQTHDNACQVAQAPLPAGALHWATWAFSTCTALQAGTPAGVALGHAATKPGRRSTTRRASAWPGNAAAQSAVPLVLPVWVGQQQRVPMVLLAQRVEECQYQQRMQRLAHRARRKQRPLSPRQRRLARWTLYLTSLPDLSFAQVHTLYRARWQVERLFKRWKSLALLTTSTTYDPHRRACEVYAKLLAVLVAHWLTQWQGWAVHALSRRQVLSTPSAPCDLVLSRLFSLPGFARPVRRPSFHTASRNCAFPPQAPSQRRRSLVVL